MRIPIILFLFFCCVYSSIAQERNLHDNWQCWRANLVNQPGERVSLPYYKIDGWYKAVVPGTVQTSLLYNKQIPDPFYGYNNELIPDISVVGRDYYTYWYITDWEEKPLQAGEQLLLHFGGINYGFEAYINGQKLNKTTLKGMFLQHDFNITSYLNKAGKNRLAVLVYPPDSVGNPNGGQGGDGLIAHGLTNQFTAGWDWIRPVRDRNTGIWDRVILKRTKEVVIEDVHVVTDVQGVRTPGGKQEPAIIKTEVTLRNTSSETREVAIKLMVALQEISTSVTIPPATVQTVKLQDVVVKNPRLWWPNNMGEQYRYLLKCIALVANQISDTKEHIIGIRSIKGVWNTHTNSRELQVNGQKIFVKGGNWIMTDALLRYSPERYDAEVHYHKNMNLNMIRVWGGGITERPEFYDACDKYGILVMQDFWVTGDCNGRWYDPTKKEDTLVRRTYPDDHSSFILAAAQHIKQLRNHPSMAIWCGGNEIRPPKDILQALRDSLLPNLDPEKIFFEYSNHDSMSLHAHDGPYVIQTNEYFWQNRSFAFNSEIGSIGIGDSVSLKRFLPDSSLSRPIFDTTSKKWIPNKAWIYHKYSGYDSAIAKYGMPNNIADFAFKAQLVNYEQYRSLMQSFTAHIWDWYTGVLEWKTQNPWTAMVGQMYDVYLDPNACLYGIMCGTKPIHAYYNPHLKQVGITNDRIDEAKGIKLKINYYDASATLLSETEIKTEIGANESAHLSDISSTLASLLGGKGGFLRLFVMQGDKALDEQLYWLPQADNTYTWLNHLPKSKLDITVKYFGGKYKILLKNKSKQVAFFNHLTIEDAVSHERILPVFFNDNFITIFPGEQKELETEFIMPATGAVIRCKGWNVAESTTEIDRQWNNKNRMFMD